MSNHYEFLNIDSTATSEDIQKSIELKREFCKQQNDELETTTIFEQLEEVEKTLLDPIRRSEYNRKLQKEQKKRSYQEQIAKEQEELQSFVENDLSKVQPQIAEIPIPDGDRETEIESSDRTQKEEILSNTKQQQIIKKEQLQKPIAIAQQNRSSVTSYPLTESIYSSTSGLKDWQKSILTGSVIGIFILLGFILIKPNTSSQQLAQTPAKTSTKTSSQISNIDDRQVNNEVSSTSSSFTQNNTQARQKQQYSPESKIVTNNYPLDSCGDKNSGGTITWYPVYVSATEENLSIIHSHYCRDAFRKYRKDVRFESIQVASFTNRSKAETLAELIRQDIESSEVGEPSVYSLNNISASHYSQNLSLNESNEDIDVNDSIALIERLYNLLSQKNFDEARSLYSSQFAFQFNSDFFNKFERVTVENLRITSRTRDSINFVGKNTYIWLDGSTQRELRSYKVSNLDGELKITGSKFIKITKSRSNNKQHKLSDNEQWKIADYHTIRKIKTR